MTTSHNPLRFMEECRFQLGCHARTRSHKRIDKCIFISLYNIGVQYRYRDGLYVMQYITVSNTASAEHYCKCVSAEIAASRVAISVPIIGLT